MKSMLHVALLLATCIALSLPLYAEESASTNQATTNSVPNSQTNSSKTEELGGKQNLTTRFLKSTDNNTPKSMFTPPTIVPPIPPNKDKEDEKKKESDWFAKGIKERQGGETTKTKKSDLTGDKKNSSQDKDKTGTADSSNAKSEDWMAEGIKNIQQDKQEKDEEKQKKDLANLKNEESKNATIETSPDDDKKGKSALPSITALKPAISTTALAPLRSDSSTSDNNTSTPAPSSQPIADDKNKTVDIATSVNKNTPSQTSFTPVQIGPNTRKISSDLDYTPQSSSLAPSSPANSPLSPTSSKLTPSVSTSAIPQPSANKIQPPVSSNLRPVRDPLEQKRF